MINWSKVLHGIGHVVWLGAQYANYASGVVPTQYQPLVAAAIGLVQAVHGWYIGRYHA